MEFRSRETDTLVLLEKYMTKKEITKGVMKWAKTLCCNEIELYIIFKKFSKEEKRDDGKWKTLAYTISNARYLESTIYFNTDLLKLVNDEAIVHELLHIKLGELTGFLYANTAEAAADKWKGYFEERFVSQMSKIITRIL